MANWKEREHLMEVLPERDQDDFMAVQELATARKVVRHKGNFTEVAFVRKDGQCALGSAKRNPNFDDPDPERGERIATIRAFRDFRENGWQ